MRTLLKYHKLRDGDIRWPRTPVRLSVRMILPSQCPSRVARVSLPSFSFPLTMLLASYPLRNGYKGRYHQQLWQSV